MTFDGDTAREAERIPLGGRIRDVAQGTDGAVYVINDGTEGAVWRISPMDTGNEASGN